MTGSHRRSMRVIAVTALSAAMVLSVTAWPISPQARASHENLPHCSHAVSTPYKFSPSQYGPPHYVRAAAVVSCDWDNYMNWIDIQFTLEVYVWTGSAWSRVARAVKWASFNKPQTIQVNLTTTSGQCAGTKQYLSRARYYQATNIYPDGYSAWKSAGPAFISC